MLMNLFILWCIASVSITIYGLVFCEPPREEFSSPVPEPKASMDSAEILPYEADMTEVVTEDDNWAA